MPPPSRSNFSITPWHASYGKSNRKPSYATSSLLPIQSLLPSPESKNAIQSFHIGTGSTVYENLAPLIIANTTHELILTTCFWSRSATNLTISTILRALSAKAVEAEWTANPDGTGVGTKCITVRICVSSLSLWQKLFHTQSPNGYVYPASKWPNALNLPPPEELPGLDIKVKSVFIKPFSVMHPKFIICDRRVAVLPSCNVSWEDWLEGALVVEEDVHYLHGTGSSPSGAIDEPSQGWKKESARGLVSSLVELWREFWGREATVPQMPRGTYSASYEEGGFRRWQIASINMKPPESWCDLSQWPAGTATPTTAASKVASQPDHLQEPTWHQRSISLLPDAPLSSSPAHIGPKTVLLPHPHSANPHLSPSISTTFPFISPYSASTPAPPTPLNDFTLSLLSSATTSIFMLTPNLTSPPVLHALTHALSHSIDVTLITNQNLMVLEQWLTAFTTTRREVRKLRRWHAAAASAASAQTGGRDVEAAPPRLGRLRVGWFTPLAADAVAAARGPLARTKQRREGAAGFHAVVAANREAVGGVGEAREAHPVKAHLKLTVVDGRVAVLGSGNMDRASWFTSQELGVGVEGEEVVGRIKGLVDGVLEGRVQWDEDA